MSSFSLHVSTDNAAFQEDDSALATILREVAERIEMAEDSGTVRDFNGNTCGRFFKTDRSASHDDAAVLDAFAALDSGDPEMSPSEFAEVLSWSGRGD